MRRPVCMAVAAALAATSAEAVVLDPHGTGQVLVYPYYTVNAGFGTLLSIVNTTETGKALKVHVREGYDGRDVLVFNLYLSPFDAWVAQIFDTSSDGSGAAAIATNDNSCTAPAFAKTFGPAPGQGPGVAAFGTAGYTGTNADGGPTGVTRTREGYVEVIEMGTVTNASHGTLNAITHGSSGIPSNCAQLIGAWDVDGYWAAKPTADLDVPGGGLYGAESIINVGEGLLYTVNAAAIDGFSGAVQNSAPGNPLPDLSSAGKDANGVVSAFVPVGPTMVQADFTRGEDAVSALFMADMLYNEYVVSPGVGAMTDWVVTFPTKRFYTDPALLQTSPSSFAPFDEAFNEYGGGTSCSGAAPPFRSREELATTFGSCFNCRPQVHSGLCFAANSIPIGGTQSVLGSKLLFTTGDLVVGFVDPFSAGFTSGQMSLDFTHDWFYFAFAPPTREISAVDGLVLKGLPALGFAATNYVNGNAAPGLLSNYSGAFPHRATIACTVAPPTISVACPAGATP